MTPFKKCEPVDEETVQKLIEFYSKHEIEFNEANIRTTVACDRYENDQYLVAVRPCGENFVHLSIKRLDQEPIHDWRDLQEIKNVLVGPDCEGIELYPAESRLVDGANQYHLWVVTDPTFRFEIGFSERLVSDISEARVKQRPRHGWGQESTQRNFPNRQQRRAAERQATK